MQVIENVKRMKFDITSANLAGGQVRTKFGGRSRESLELAIFDLVGQTMEPKTAKEAEVLLGYTVQETVRSYLAGKSLNNLEVVEIARKKTQDLMKKQPYLFIESEDMKTIEVEKVVDGETVVQKVEVKAKSKKGGGPSKKDICLALYRANLDKTPKERIQIFIEKGGCTEKGAPTYEYNCRKGIWQ